MSTIFLNVDTYDTCREFGYVSATDDYKIVLTAIYYVPDDLDSMGEHQAMVYSVKAGRWTVVDTDTDQVVECQ